MAQRVPVFFEFERAVAYAVWNLGVFFEETESAVRVSGLSINAGQLFLDQPAIDRVPGGRKQLGGVFAFPNRVG